MRKRSSHEILFYGAKRRKKWASKVMEIWPEASIDQIVEYGQYRGHPMSHVPLAYINNFQKQTAYRTKIVKRSCESCGRIHDTCWTRLIADEILMLYCNDCNGDMIEGRLHAQFKTCRLVKKLYFAPCITCEQPVARYIRTQYGVPLHDSCNLPATTKEVGYYRSLIVDGIINKYIPQQVHCKLCSTGQFYVKPEETDVVVVCTKCQKKNTVLTMARHFPPYKKCGVPDSLDMSQCFRVPAEFAEIGYRNSRCQHRTRRGTNCLKKGSPFCKMHWQVAWLLKLNPHIGVKDVAMLIIEYI
jgi:hypothetical protein